MDFWALQYTRREAFPKDVSSAVLLPASSSPAQGHTRERLQPPLPSGLSFPSLIRAPALPSPAQEPLGQHSPEWSLFDPPSKALIAIFQGSTSNVIPVCHWDSWRSSHGTQRSLPPSLPCAHYVAGLASSFSHTMNELIMPTNSNH